MAGERLNETENKSRLNPTESRVLDGSNQDAETRAAQAAARERENQRKAEEARRAKEEQEQQKRDAEKIMGGKLWDVVSKANAAVNGCKEAGIPEAEISKLKDKNRGAIRENGSLNCVLLNPQTTRDAIRVAYKTMDGVIHTLDIKTNTVVKAKEGTTGLGLLDKANYDVDMKKIMKLVNNDFKAKEALAWRSNVNKVVEEGVEGLAVSKLSDKAKKYLRDNDFTFNGKMDFQRGFGDGISVVNGKLKLGNDITFDNLSKYYAIGSFKEGEFVKDLNAKIGVLADRFYANKFSTAINNLSKNYGQMDADSLEVKIKDLDTQIKDAKNIGINLEDKTDTLAKAKDALKEKKEKAAASKEFDRVYKIYDKEFKAIKRTLDSRTASEVERDQAKTKLEGTARLFKAYRIGSNMRGPRGNMNLVDVIKKSEKPTRNRARYDELRKRYIDKAKLHRLDV